MSDPASSRMPGPGPSVLYQSAMRAPASLGLFASPFESFSYQSRIHQSSLTGVSIPKIAKDPFNVLMIPGSRFGLGRRILCLAGNTSAASEASCVLKTCIQHAKKNVEVVFGKKVPYWRSVPVFFECIRAVLDENPEEFLAIRDAILQGDSYLYSSSMETAAQQCRLLEKLVRPKIQEKMDVNLIRFFAPLNQRIGLEDRPIPSADIHRHAEGIRKWMNEHREFLNGITDLNLRAMDLELLPPEVSKLVNLQILILSHNRLSIFPDVSDLKKLKILYLSNNQFSRFPEEILQLEGLTGLYLGNNRLQSIPAIFAARLKDLNYIDFRGNRLTSLPKDVYDIRRLHSLNLSRNPDFDQRFPFTNITIRDRHVVMAHYESVGRGGSRIVDIDIRGTLIAIRIASQR